MSLFRLPPFWFLLAVAAQFWIAWHADTTVSGWTVLATGTSLLILGAALVLGAWASFRKWRTPIKPFSEPTHLITDGVFRISRNPVYLGQALMLAGLACLHGNWAAALVIPPFIATVQMVFIGPEETIMAARFGSAFTAYRKRVRRWI